jgi:hypothetical protein
VRGELGEGRFLCCNPLSSKEGGEEEEGSIVEEGRMRRFTESPTKCAERSVETVAVPLPVATNVAGKMALRAEKVLH